MLSGRIIHFNQRNNPDGAAFWEYMNMRTKGRDWVRQLLNYRGMNHG